MATTSPDNIFSPNAGDQYALVQDMGALADSVQTALSRRGNFYIGTGAQRSAFADAPDGVNWQDTDGSQKRYVRVSGEWIMSGDGYYYGTAAQRTAFTTAPDGVFWRDTTGDRVGYMREGGSWIPSWQSGTFSFSTVAANSAASTSITFPTAFPRRPIVVTSLVTANNQLGGDARAVTASNFNLVARSYYTSSISPAVLRWDAFLL